MYRKFAAIACVAAAAWSLSSCKNGNDNKISEAQTAFNQAQEAYNTGDARQCITLLDSLDRKYADDIEVMKQSMQLRPKALIIITEEDIAAADSTISANKAAIDSLKPLMTHIDVPGTEGYMLKSSAVDPAFMNKTGVSPRVSEIGEFYLVSSLNPAGGLQHWSLSAVVGDMIATTDTVRYDGALNFRTNNSEVITFTPAGSKSIGELVAFNPGLPVKILFNGQNGRNRSISLNAAQIDAIATAYRYATAVNDMRDATIELERLNTRHAKLQQQTGVQ
ncbi:MAG: hypothetical protein K2L73_02655 [Muribaculaceae bacterium]|nr:hypothetical protein [Muribaculaceae bacterium]